MDRTNAGSVDSNLWHIVRHYAGYKMSRNDTSLREHWQSLEKSFLCLRYQDSNG